VDFRLARGVGAPRADLRLARSLPSTHGTSPAPPDRSIKCLDTPRTPRSKGESSPRRSPDTTWESNPGAVRGTHHCAAIPGAVQVLCGVAGVIPQHCATHSRPSYTSRPSKGDGNTLEKRTVADPTFAHDSAMTRGGRSTSHPSPAALCGHPRSCATIPEVVEPCFDGVPPRRTLYSTSAPVGKTLELMYERQPDVDTERTTLEAAPQRVQSRHDTRKSRDSSGQHQITKHCMLVLQCCTEIHAALL
jgi:hypothetical protein